MTEFSESDSDRQMVQSEDPKPVVRALQENYVNDEGRGVNLQHAARGAGRDRFKQGATIFFFHFNSSIKGLDRQAAFAGCAWCRRRPYMVDGGGWRQRKLTELMIFS